MSIWISKKLLNESQQQNNFLSLPFHVFGQRYQVYLTRSIMYWSYLDSWKNNCVHLNNKFMAKSSNILHSYERSLTLPLPYPHSIVHFLTSNRIYKVSDRSLRAANAQQVKCWRTPETAWYHPQTFPVPSCLNGALHGDRFPKQKGGFWVIKEKRRHQN